MWRLKQTGYMVCCTIWFVVLFIANVFEFCNVCLESIAIYVFYKKISKITAYCD